MQAHAFESEIQRVRQSGGDVGAALLALPLPLEDMLGRVAALKTITGMHKPAPVAPEAINSAVTRLAVEVAGDERKKVVAAVRLGAIADLEAGASHLVREIAVQLVRNAVVHGVEAPGRRLATGKPEAGRVDVQLSRGEGEWTLSVRDDGAGLDARSVRDKLLQMGWYTNEQLANFNDRQIVAHIFKPGFSTATGVSMHAGRGVGLDVVQANVQKLGARLLLSSTPGQFTEFRVKFA
jgi:signal transduction histidine kinase